MKLYLIRHAQPAETTGDARLSEAGRKQAEMLGNLFRQLMLDREVLKIVSSDAQRARETAEIVCGALEVPPEEIALFPAPIDNSPPADPVTMAERLMKRLQKFHSQGSQTIIVVGHFPYLSRGLALILGDDAMQFPKDYGAVASIDCPETSDGATGNLEWFVIPHV
ncbi:histidine-type phosphatase [Candidatus Poribacteria bacterium]|nr:histidine-type phosphatase [Candidatus Poribacteria bacterium]